MTPTLKVKASELKFGWDHKRKPSTCVISHGDKVVKRGTYEDLFKLFHLTQSGGPDSTVTIQYEE